MIKKVLPTCAHITPEIPSQLSFPVFFFEAIWTWTCEHFDLCPLDFANNLPMPHSATTTRHQILLEQLFSPNA